MVPQHQLTARQQAWMRALDKAQRLSAAPEQIWDGYYAVTGSTGGEYFVTRMNHQATWYACTCLAGQADKPCYHAAAVAALPEETASRAAHRRELAVADSKAAA